MIRHSQLMVNQNKPCANDIGLTCVNGMRQKPFVGIL